MRWNRQGSTEIEGQFFIATALVFMASFVQTSIGFGLAVVAAPFLFFLEPAYVPGPIIMAALFNSAFTCWRFRAHLELGALKFAIVGRVPGSIVGAGLLLVMSPPILAILIAAVIGLGMGANFLRINIPFTRRNLGIAGFLSGVMGTSTSIGGPPMAIMMQGQQANVIRGNLAAFYMFSCVISLLMLLLTGHLGSHELMLAAPLIPASLMGSVLASHLHGFIKEELMRRGCLLLCGISVTMMLLNYLTA